MGIDTTSAAAAGVLQRVLEYVEQRVRYAADPPGADYWQTPVESFRRGAGDCEDFAIACWGTATRWAADPDLRDLIGEARLAWLLSDTGDVSHMVCVATPLGEVDPWVLDVLADQVHRLSERDDGLHVAVTLGIDDDGVPACWQGLNGEKSKVAPAKWADVVRRLDGREGEVA